MKILAVLRVLMLSPVGILLTNEGVCEILQSTFKICFEIRLSDLLRKTAELALNDMIQLLFKRLPTFSEENLPLLKKLKMRNSGSNEGKSRRKRHEDGETKRSRAKSKSTKDVSPAPNSTQKKNHLSSEDNKSLDLTSSPASTDPVSPGFSVDADVLARSPTGSVTDLSQIQSDNEGEPSENKANEPIDQPDATKNPANEQEIAEASDVKVTVTSPKGTEYNVDKDESKKTTDDKADLEKEEDGAKVASEKEFVNAQGVTFTPTAEMVDDSGSLIPYGLPCVRELFRFLTSLISPHDGIASTTGGSSTSSSSGGITFQNDSMIQIALSLLATALETGVDHLDKYESLLDLVKDDVSSRFKNYQYLHLN